MADESPEPYSGGDTAAEKLRASHDDRARAIRRLQMAGAAGRLEPDEVDERTTAALAARTLGDLQGLVADLPGQLPLSSGGAEPERDQIVSELYNAKRDGRWTVPVQLDVRVNSGSVTLDFTEAEIISPTLHIDASVRGGSLTLITRPGIDVHTHDLMVDSGSVKVDAPWGEDGWPTVLSITVTGAITVGEMTVRPARRNLREWLRGDPGPYTTGS
jgi:hypothetical protein